MTSKRPPAARPRCNVAGCPAVDDLTRGLCPPHWGTHRGLADSPPIPDAVSDDHPEVAFP